MVSEGVTMVSCDAVDKEENEGGGSAFLKL